MTRSPAFRRLLVTGVVFFCAATVSYGALRSLYGMRPAYVHVRWAAGIDDGLRRELEQRFSLSDGDLRDDRTWSYLLSDVSRDNIRALVTDASVEDTHQLHRTAFRPGYFAPRQPYRTAHPWIPAALEIATLLLFGLAALALAAAAVEATGTGMSRGPAGAIRNLFLHPLGAARAILTWFEHRIPVMSPEAAALFRIVFGLAVMAIVLRRPVDPAWGEAPTNTISTIHRELAALLADHPGIARMLPAWVAVSGLAFVAGFFTRLSFALLTIGVFAWAILDTTRTTYHTISALLVTLLCLQWSRWGDAWSIDAWKRRHPDRVLSPSRLYGYTVWMPGFILGLILLAAAFAKLRDSGIAWILNGTVKYHFLSDSRQAVVDWGLQVSRHHELAVLLSLSAIAIETFVILGALSTRYAYRLIAGMAALGLLAGFTLFQGLFWPGWWVLLLSFLPWHRIGGRRQAVPGDKPSPSSNPIRQAPVVVVFVLVLIQLAMSVGGFEVSPLLSTYDMYSTTYSSPAEYEQKSADSYWLVATDTAGTRRTCRISRREADVLSGAAVVSDPGQVREGAVTRCFGGQVSESALTVEGSRIRVDWERWRLEEPLRTRIDHPLR